MLYVHFKEYRFKFFIVSLLGQSRAPISEHNMQAREQSQSIKVKKSVPTFSMAAVHNIEKNVWFMYLHV